MRIGGRVLCGGLGACVFLSALAAAGADETPRMSDLLRAQVRAGLIEIVALPQLTQQVTAGAVQTQLRNADGTATLQATPAGVPRIDLRREDQDHVVIDTVAITPTALQVSATTMGKAPGGGTSILQTVRLEQAIHPQVLGGPADGNLKLSINDKDSGTNVTFNEKTFADMMAKHPDEMHTYVMALFQRLDLQGIFPITAPQALHAFAPMLKIDAAIEAKVQALLPKLDDDSPAVRTAAAADLAVLGPAAVAVLTAMDMPAQPVQVRASVKIFLAAMKDDHVDDPDFVMLCLAVDDPQIPALAKKQWEKLTGAAIDFDDKAPVEQRQAAMEKPRAAAIKAATAK